MVGFSQQILIWKGILALDQVVLEDIVVKALPQYIYKRIIHEYVFHTSPLLIIVIIVIFMNMLFIPHHPYMDQVLQAVASVDIGGRSEENPGWENGSSRHCDSPFHKRSRETIIEWTWKASSPQLDWLGRGGRAAWYEDDVEGRHLGHQVSWWGL